MSAASHSAGRAPATLFDKIWAMHAIRELGEGVSLLHVDRYLLHDLEGGPRLSDLRTSGRTVARPDLTFATPDHAMSSAPDRNSDT
jgi:3-isopropylmalate/(R)-2-methylmalate dehydratase large subunit